MAQWFYSQSGGPQSGPVDDGQVHQMIAAGQLGAGDLVWTEGMGSWQPVAAVPTLAGMLPASAYPGTAAPSPGMGAFPDAGYGYAPPGGAPLGYYAQQTQTFAYAGFWARFAAAFIDGLIVGVPFFLLGLALGAAQGTTPGQPTSPGMTAASAGLNLLNLIVAWLYEALQISSPAMATIGKRALGIVVTDVNGQRIGFGRATGRHFAKFISGCTLLIGYIMAAFTEKKQALHDIMAGTLVLRK